MATEGLDAGDDWARDGDVVNHLSAASSSAFVKGDMVKFDGSGNLTATTANGDAYIGVAKMDAQHSNNSTDPVQVRGPVMLNADGAISEGDVLLPSGSTNGHVVSHPVAEVSDLSVQVDEGGTSTYDLPLNPVVAMESASDGDVFRAMIF